MYKIGVVSCCRINAVKSKNPKKNKTKLSTVAKKKKLEKLLLKLFIFSWLPMVISYFTGFNALILINILLVIAAFILSIVLFVYMYRLQPIESYSIFTPVLGAVFIFVITFAFCVPISALFAL